MPSPQNLSNFVWGIADQLRGVFRPNQYGTLVLPLTILRRMEAVMDPHRLVLAGSFVVIEQAWRDGLDGGEHRLDIVRGGGARNHEMTPFAWLRAAPLQPRAVKCGCGR